MVQPARSSAEPRTVAIAVLVVLVVVIAAIFVLRALGIGQDRPPVLLLGDSITHNLNGPIKRQLGGHFAFSVDGKAGFYATHMVGDADAASRFPYEQAVVNLGTNDVNDSSHDLDATIASLEQIIGTLSTFQCVHVVTVSEAMVFANGDSSARAQRLNGAIRAVAEQHPNVTVIDWAAIVREHSGEAEALTTDTVHPSEAGNRVLADAYGDALADCPD